MTGITGILAELMTMFHCKLQTRRLTEDSGLNKKPHIISTDNLKFIVTRYVVISQCRVTHNI